MRIERARVDILDIPFREPVSSGDGRWERRRTAILRLDTDDGRQALGEFPAAQPDGISSDIAAQLVAALEGIEMADPVTVEATLREIDAWPLVGRAVRAAVESAFVDLLAQVRGQPVSRFLYAPAAADVAVNAMLGIATAEDNAATAAGLVADGYRCLKLKAGGEPEGALEGRLEAVRSAVGSEVALRLDFNGSLPTDSAADVLAAVADYDIEYVEQPISPSAGVEALARLRWIGAVPIAADESVRDVGAARVLLDSGAVDALVVKPARVGGLRQAAAIIELATTASVPVTVSTLFETGVGLAGALHLAATAPGPQAHGLATADLLDSDLLVEPLPVSYGRMTVPESTGLGIELDLVALERYLLP